MFSERECNSLCCMPPSAAIDKAREFGLTTVPYKVIPASEANEYMLRVLFIFIFN